LHFEDINKLLKVLSGLVDKGNTVIVIDHNLDVIKTADWIIDMGPEGGSGGGLVVAEGTPEEVAAVPTSHTGKFLREILGADLVSDATPARRKAAKKTVAADANARTATVKAKTAKTTRTAKTAKAAGTAKSRESATTAKKTAAKRTTNAPKGRPAPRRPSAHRTSRALSRQPPGQGARRSPTAAGPPPRPDTPLSAP